MIVRTQILLVEIFASKVESLSRKISDNICYISSPEGEKSLFDGNSIKTIGNALVMLRF